MYDKTALKPLLWKFTYYIFDVNINYSHPMSCGATTNLHSIFLVFSWCSKCKIVYVTKQEDKYSFYFLLRLFQRSCIYGIEKKSCGIVASHDTDLEFNFCFPVYQIILGTIETKDSADIEWVYRPYMNTAKKRKFLAEDE